MRRAFRQYLLPACIILMSLVVVLSFNEGRAQMSTDAYAWKHFLDEPPAAADLSPLPIGARDVLLAKVRIVGRIFWRGKRDQSGQAPPPPKRIFGAEVEIVDVLSGNAAKGARHIVSFGVPILGRRDMYPVTPRMYARDYFIVSYLDQDSERELVGFSASEQEYEEWIRNVSEYERQRGRPGARD